MGTRTVEKGPIAEAVAENVRAVRERRGLTQKQLAALLTEYGRPALPSTVAKIEAGERRVDVDDLVVFALALNVSPARLLVTVDDLDEIVQLAANREAPAWSVWQWVTGQHALGTDEEDVRDLDVQRRELDFLNERPLWLRTLDNHPLMRAVKHLQWAATRAVRGAGWGATLEQAFTSARQQAEQLD